MATEKLLIDLQGVNMDEVDTSDCTDIEDILSAVITYLSEQPIVDAVEVVHAPTVVAYTAHEVAEILAEAFGDSCACNFNGNDEWLPEKCELLSACPNPVGVACWEQYLKYRDRKMDGDRNGN